MSSGEPYAVASSVLSMTELTSVDVAGGSILTQKAINCLRHQNRLCNTYSLCLRTGSLQTLRTNERTNLLTARRQTHISEICVKKRK